MIMGGIGGIESLAIGVLLVLIGTLAYVSSRRRGGTPSELGFGVLVAIGALAAPQFAAVILLALIYQQLVRNAPKP